MLFPVTDSECSELEDRVGISTENILEENWDLKIQ